MKERITSTKERPIIFSTEMVKAILDLKKTQTRRVIKPQPTWTDGTYCVWGHTFAMGLGKMLIEEMLAYCPYGQVGDRLWVRETFCEPSNSVPFSHPAYHYSPYLYAADDNKMFIPLGGNWYQHNNDFKWSPSIFMPRLASRINLEITNIRAERVQDISDKDVQEEGCKYPQWQGSFTSWKGAYKALWDSINAKRGYSWESNPWVWVIEFKVIR